MTRTLFDRPDRFFPVEPLVEAVALKVIPAGESQELGLHRRQQFHDVVPVGR